MHGAQRHSVGEHGLAMIVVRLQGGLGNQMFQYALGRSLALRHNTTLKLDLTFLLDRTPRPGWVFRDYELGDFQIAAGVATRGDIPFLFRRYGAGLAANRLDARLRKFLGGTGVERNFAFDRTVLEAGDGTYLCGYWQSHKYFAGIEDTLRLDFTPRQSLPDKILSFCSTLACNGSVCLHVRRTDFVTNSAHGAFSAEYYRTALNAMMSLRPYSFICVFTDDVGWCRTHLHFPCEMFFVEERFPGLKNAHYLAMMAHCRAFVLSNSTFGWWAAWLSNAHDKMVVAPKRWFADASINTDDLIPTDWVRV